MCIRLEALNTAGVRFGIKGIVCAKSVPSSPCMSATEEKLSSFKQVKENPKKNRSSPNCNVFAFIFFFQSYSRCQIHAALACFYFNFIYMLNQIHSCIISHPCAVEACVSHPKTDAPDFFFFFCSRFKDPPSILHWRRWFEMNWGCCVDATAWHF